MASEQGQMRVRSGEARGSAQLVINDGAMILDLDRDTVIKMAETLMDIAGVSTIVRPVRIGFVDARTKPPGEPAGG